MLVVTTAPRAAAGAIRSGLEALGAQHVQFVHSLSDRGALRAEMEAAQDADAVLVEVKAAAADLVLPWATSRGIRVGFLHNRVEPEDGIQSNGTWRDGFYFDALSVASAASFSSARAPARMFPRA